MAITKPKHWPQVIDHAIWLYHCIPWMDISIHSMSNALKNWHVWGCPMFILEPKLQKTYNVKIPKQWAPHSKQGINLGFSK